MDIWDAIILGLVQGVTEFLPVSSSGHLALSRSVLGFAPQTGAAF
ncbi:MAG TPA: undecaprenyl-diphosphate phosphatase, partial [Planctomycetota bacterium]|nr:undecaprenyl-diphosphate phosphatase [Planctomycetota bacterium]